MTYYKNFNLDSIMYYDINGIKQIEQWSDILNFEGKYMVSDLGRIKSLKRERISKNNSLAMSIEIIRRQGIYKEKYLSVFLFSNGKAKSYKVHRLVMQAFVSNPLNFPLVEHINDNPSDNRLVNLKWSTHKENTNNAWKNGLCKAHKGQKHGGSKLKNKDVLSIRASNLTQKDIAILYKVSVDTIHKIINRKLWKHI